MPKIYSIKQYAEMQGCSVANVYRIISVLKEKKLRSNDDFKFIQLDKTYLIQPTKKFYAELFKNRVKKFEKAIEEHIEYIRSEDSLLPPFVCDND